MRFVVAALAVVVATGGCGTSSPERHDAPMSAAASSMVDPSRSATDVAFLQNMIKHHEQAIELSAMASERSANPQVVALAQHVAGQQRTEIDGLRAQLLQWEEPLVARPGTGIAGMVDQATRDKLTTLPGVDFDKLWLQSMMAHHQGAIDMAKAEIAHGQSLDVISIAKSLAASQQAEIDQINQQLESR